MRISGSNAGYTMFRGSVKSTGFQLRSPVSPSLPLPCATVCHHISTGLYTYRRFWPHSVWYGRLPVKTTLLKFVFPECYSKYPNKIQYGHQRGAGSTYCWCSNKAMVWMVRCSKSGKEKKVVSSPKSPDRTTVHSPSY